MSSNDPSYYDDEDIDEELVSETDEEAIEAAGEEAGIEPNETVIVRNQKQKQPIDILANHPKIRKILENPDVVEVHLRYKMRGNRRVQPYACIIYTDGSSIERPLADIEANERPVCPPRDEIVPSPPQQQQPRRRKWYQIFARNDDDDRDRPYQSGDVRTFTSTSRTRDGNCTIIKKKSMTIVCDRDRDDTPRRNRRRRHNRRYQYDC